MPPFAYFGIESKGLSLIIDLLIVFAFVLYFSLIYWTYVDARRRIEDPMLVGCAFAASLFPFAGTIVYMVLRPPEYLQDAHERELEIQAAEAKLYELDVGLCPHCDYRIERDFVRCPSCLRKLKDRCVSCQRPLDREWAICPYCETEVADAAPARRRRRREPDGERQAASPPAGWSARQETGETLLRDDPSPHDRSPLDDRRQQGDRSLQDDLALDLDGTGAAAELAPRGRGGPGGSADHMPAAQPAAAAGAAAEEGAMAAPLVAPEPRASRGARAPHPEARRRPSP